MADLEKGPEFNLKRRPFNPQDIVSYCGSLVTTQISTNEIRLAHYSVQEFLVSNRLTSGCRIYKITKQTANITIAKTCLVYVTSAPGSTGSVLLKGFPRAQYAAEFWITHAKAAEDTHTDDLTLRIVRFLECEQARSNWIQLYEPDRPWEGLNEYDDMRVANPPLYYASFAGLQRPVRILLENGADVNMEGGYYGNALQAASAKGGKAIVQLLLEKGADINVQGGRYGSAALAARYWGYEKVVQLLESRMS
jgi:hypothetical protein